MLGKSKSIKYRFALPDFDFEFNGNLLLTL